MSELDEVMKKLGGVFDPESNQCLNFGNVDSEYDPTLNHVYDFTNHTHLELTGDDRTKFLNSFCSAKIIDLPPGEGTEAFVLNISGHILQHIFIFITENSIQIESGPNAEESLHDHFDHYLITEDVEIHRCSNEWSSLFLTGNEIVSFLKEQGVSNSDWPVNSHSEIEFNQTLCKIRRVDILDQPGFILCCPKEKVTSVWEFFVEAGVSPAGEESWQAKRIESGFPVYGVDITEKNLAQEASRSEQTISFTKGCYLGQETVARIDSVGRVNKQLCKLEFQGIKDSLPESGVPLLDPEKIEIGLLTSLAWSPGRNSIVALGYLKSDFVSPGTKILLSCGLSGKVI
jgi:tRNA-modifying protein YgfZ